MGVAIINHVDGQPCFLDTFFFARFGFVLS